MMDPNRGTPIQEQQWNTAVHVPTSTPFVKTCCAPGEGAIPINIPIYNPLYYGNHVLSGASGVIPQQPYVFASPLPKAEPVYHAQPVVQQDVAYQVQLSGQQQGVAAEQPLNVTHYVWKQTPRDGEQQMQRQGTTLKRTSFLCCNEAPASVRQEQSNQETVVETTEEQKEQQVEEAVKTEEEEPKVEKQPKAKKQPVCGFLTSCCRVPEEYPGFENATTNVFHMNTLFRENTSASDSAPSVYQLQSVSRGSSIHGSVSVPITSMGSMIPQTSITSQSGLIPQNSIMQQASIPSHAGTNFWHLNTLFQEAPPRPQVPMCFNVCYPRSNSIQTEAIVPMTTIATQPSISVVPAPGFFHTCCGARAPTMNVAALPTQNSFGGVLESLVSSPPSQRSVVSTVTPVVESLSRQLSNVNIQPVVTDAASGAIQTGSSRLLASPHLLVQDTAVVHPPSDQQKKAPMKPTTFKLHAVEIHQFVALPNGQDSKFVETVGNMNQQGAPMFQHGYGIQHPNCFFNPNTTGYIAPVMRDVMGGVENPAIPHMYSMDSSRSRQAVRMQTEDSQITAREYNAEESQQEAEEKKEQEEEPTASEQ